MPPAKDPVANEWMSINLAFSKQAAHFDRDDFGNPILQAWRSHIYDHVNRFLKPGNTMLELNAGTGIDAMHFAKQGHEVLATDLSAGMVKELQKKIVQHQLPHLSARQISFTDLDQLGSAQFDYVFSNFGGLNCVRDLSLVTRKLPARLNKGAYLTWVIMPPFCPWELLRLFRGTGLEAFRRFRTGGTMARLEGEYFQTYYHSLSEIRKALGDSFQLMGIEGLGIFSAPPAAHRFYQKYPRLNRILQKVDGQLRGQFPFNRWGDHIVVTFKYVY